MPKHALSRHFFRPELGSDFHLDGDRYVLSHEIGDGAAGSSIERRGSVMDRPSLAKFLAPILKYIEEASFNDVPAVRFKHEGERGTRLSHHSLVKIIGCADNTNAECFAGAGPANPFLLMEYAGGISAGDLHSRPSARSQRHSNT